MMVDLSAKLVGERSVGTKSKVWPRFPSWLAARTAISRSTSTEIHVVGQVSATIWGPVYMLVWAQLF